MRTNKVEICGINTAELKSLKEEEKRRLLAKAKAGDKDARDALVMGNLRLVLSVISKFNQKNELPDDLFQVGCIGLIKAIDNFNINLDVRFSTYAVPMIIGEVRRYLRDNNSIRVIDLRQIDFTKVKYQSHLLDNVAQQPIQAVSIK